MNLALTLALPIDANCRVAIAGPTDMSLTATDFKTVQTVTT